MLTQKNPNVAGNIEEKHRIMVWALQRHYTQELENMVVSEVNTKIMCRVSINVKLKHQKCQLHFVCIQIGG